jgi:hypothetical protein
MSAASAGTSGVTAAETALGPAQANIFADSMSLWIEFQTEAQLVFPETKKSGLKVVTLIATLNPVSQVLW